MSRLEELEAAYSRARLDNYDLERTAWAYIKELKERVLTKGQNDWIEDFRKSTNSITFEMREQFRKLFPKATP